MIGASTQESGSTSMCPRQLDNHYVTLVRLALNGTQFYIMGDQRYNVLEELGNIGLEYVKVGKLQTSRIISDFLKVREMVENGSDKIIFVVDKICENKIGIGYKVNVGGHPVDNQGNPIDYKNLKGVDYSSRIDKALKSKGGYANLLDKKSRVKARTDIWRSSTNQKALNSEQDGAAEVQKLYSGSNGDFRKAEQNFYSAAREFEALGDKKSSERLYARAIACRMMGEENYESALSTLKVMEDKLYQTAFSELIDNLRLKEGPAIGQKRERIITEKPKEVKPGKVEEAELRKTLYTQIVTYMESERKKPEEADKKKGYVFEEGVPSEPIKRTETTKELLGGLLKNIGIPEDPQGRIRYVDRLAKDIAPILSEEGKNELPKTDKPIKYTEPPNDMPEERSRATLKTPPLSYKTKEPWETDVVKKTVRPFEKAYRSYRNFIDNVVIGKGDELGRNIATGYKNLMQKLKKREKPVKVKVEYREPSFIRIDLLHPKIKTAKSVIKTDEKDADKTKTSYNAKEPWETDVVKKAVGPLKKGYTEYRSFLDKVVIEGGDRLGKRIASKYKSVFEKKGEKETEYEPKFIRVDLLHPKIKTGEPVKADEKDAGKVRSPYKTKEPWETDVVKKVAHPFKKGYIGYRTFIKKSIQSGDELGIKIDKGVSSAYRSIFGGKKAAHYKQRLAIDILHPKITSGAEETAEK